MPHSQFAGALADERIAELRRQADHQRLGSSRPPGWTRQAIARGAADRGVRAIRLPVHVDEEIGRLCRTQARLHERLGRERTDQELAERSQLPVERVARLQRTAQAITSLDAPVGDDGAALQDFLEDDQATGPGEVAVEAAGRRALEQALSALPARERQVLVLRFGLVGFHAAAGISTLVGRHRSCPLAPSPHERVTSCHVVTRNGVGSLRGLRARATVGRAQLLLGPWWHRRTRHRGWDDRGARSGA